MDLQNKIKLALGGNKLATISTVDIANTKPQSALVAFVENDKLELYFQTSNKTRKYRNFSFNKSVAFVIGFGWTTLQYEGTAEEVSDKYEIEDVKELFAKKDSPTTRYYLELPDTVIFKVTPHWIGYRNYHVHPPEIAELKF